MMSSGWLIAIWTPRKWPSWWWVIAKSSNQVCARWNLSAQQLLLSTRKENQLRCAAEAVARIRRNKQIELSTDYTARPRPQPNKTLAPSIDLRFRGAGLPGCNPEGC